MKIKAIKTVYGGYKFRSRLEARWAVFFDSLGVEWEYEKEGYHLGVIKYLPDFFLPKMSYRGGRPRGTWIEIKPKKPNSNEEEKCRRLSLMTNKPTIIFYGLPGENTGLDYSFGGWDNEMAIMKCGKCGKIKIEYSAESNYRKCPHCDSGFTTLLPGIFLAKQYDFK